MSREATANRNLIATAAILTLLLAFGSSSAARADYSCTVNTSTLSSTCGSPVTVNAFSGGQALLVARPGGFGAMVVKVDACNPTGFSVNIGDSYSNNGGGGDSGTAQHDAELQIEGNTYTAYTADYTGNAAAVIGGGVVSSGCTIQQFYIRNDFVEFDPNTSLAGDSLISSHPFLIDFPPYDEADAEDPSGNESEVVYIGLNRVVFNPFGRVGTGVRRACVYLSTSAFPSAATVTAACGF